MRFCYGTIIGLSLGGVLLGGCGGSSGTVADTSPPSSVVASSSTLSGRVVDAQGRGQAGVKLGFQERETGEVAVAETGADGSFSQQMPTGVYDVGLEKESDPSTAGCFYGPVTVQGPSQRDFVLQSSGGHTSAEVFGQLLLQPGQPGANRRIVVVPVAADFLGEELPLEPVETRTDAAGNFAVKLFDSESLGINLQVYHADGTFDELIDVDMHGGKPSFVQVITEEPGEEENLVGYGESLAGPEGGTKEPTLLPAREIRARNWSEFNDIDLEGQDGGALYPFLVTLKDGSFPVGTGHVRLEVSTRVRPRPDFRNYQAIIDFLSKPNVNGMNFPSMAVSNDVRGVRWFFFKQAFWVYSTEYGYFLVYDKSGDVYKLSVNDRTVWHSVAYNSDEPTITAIKFFKYVDNSGPVIIVRPNR